MKNPDYKIIGVIPARYGSTRFPGKPLVEIKGKSLIQRTYENAAKCASFDSIIIATDDKRIYEHADSFGADVVMTSSDCLTGTDRVLEAINNIKDNIDDSAIIVNVQGDEPCISPDTINTIIEALIKNPDAVMATAASKITDIADLKDPSVVKCALDTAGNALYFSRSCIPYVRNPKKMSTHHRHLGIYAFRKEFLLKYSQLAPTPLQLAEDLEQLKILERGYKIKVAIVEDSDIGVNTPDDAKKLEKILCNQNSYSSPAE